MSLVPYSGGSGSSLPMLVLVLTGENYTTWAIKVEANLDAAGLWKAVVPAEDSTSAVVAKKDKPAGAYQLGALSEDLLLQVSSKKTAAEVWSSLKTRFIRADRVRAARLATLRSDFDWLRMDGGEDLDTFDGRIGSMAARFAGLGTMLGDAVLVKKLLDTVPDRLYPPSPESNSSVTSIPWRLRRRWVGSRHSTNGRVDADRNRQDGGGHSGDQLLLTAAQWAAKQWRQGGFGIDRDGDGVGTMASGGGGGRRGRCYGCGQRGHFWRECPKSRKAQAAEQALLVEGNVENDGLL